MDNWTHHFKNTLTSSSHLILDYIYNHSKTLLYSFREREKGPKVNKICKLFSDLNICLHYHIFIHLQIAHEHIHLCITRFQEFSAVLHIFLIP